MERQAATGGNVCRTKTSPGVDGVSAGMLLISPESYSGYKMASITIHHH